MNIWSDCKKLPLTEVLSFIVDNRGKTVPTTTSGHILIATNCIKNDRLYPCYEKIRFLSEDTYQSFFRSHPIPGDILFVCKGTPGRCALVPDPIDFCIAQDMVGLRANKSIIDNKYLLAVLRSYEIQKFIYNTSVGDVIPHFKKQFFNKLLIPVPPMELQTKIGAFYYSISQKIENNNKINANLEAQAQALFKSWFVDFTPFKDQPFVDSELGPIPQGWKVGKADDFYKINIGKTPPRKEKEWFSKNESDNKWISISDMGNCGLFISNSAEKLTNAAIKKFNISLVPVNTILLSFKLTIGRVAISDCDLTTNEAIARFILPDECYLEFSFLMLKLYNYSTLGSTSSIATAVNSKIIKSMKMVMPSLKVLEDFHTITNPLFEKIRFTQKENQRLAALRDTLLPKLMSGEIKL